MSQTTAAPAPESRIQIIPLSRLKPSPLNVRRSGGKRVEELAASIRAGGLHQNLGVVPNADGKSYGVAFGGRRLRALKALAKAGQLPAALADGIPCKVMTEDEAREASLSENTLREAMAPLDQFEAFRSLVEAGQIEAEVAARFGVSELVVRQRMRLSRVSPKLLQEYGAGEMRLDQLQAFAVSDDHKRQEAVWKDCKGSVWSSQPDKIRSELMREEVGPNDKRAVFVGREAYVAAGGRLREDLFSDEVIFLDVPLLDALVGEKLQAIADLVRAQGWSWVEITSEPLNHLARLAAPEFDDLSAAEQEELESLEQQAPPLTPEQWVRYLALTEPAFTQEQKASSGVIIVLRWAGVVDFFTGLLRDGEQVPAGDASEGDEDSGYARTVNLGATPGAVDDAPERDQQPAERQPWELSMAGTQRLQAEATAAVQRHLTKTPHVALALLASQLARSLYTRGHHHRQWVYISRQEHSRTAREFREVAASTASGQEMQQLEEQWRQTLPQHIADLDDWLLQRDPRELHQLLAFLIAREVEAVDSPQHAHDQDVVDLVELSGTDLAALWSPTEDWLNSMPKAAVIAMVADARGEKVADPLAKRKKGQLAALALPLFPAGWLPPQLRRAHPEPSERKQHARGKMAAAGDLE